MKIIKANDEALDIPLENIGLPLGLKKSECEKLLIIGEEALLIYYHKNIV